MFGLLWILFRIEEKLNIFLRSKKLLHFFFRFAVVRVACFLFCQQLGIFRVQLFDLGEFFQVDFIKRRLCSFVQRDLRAVRFQKALAVSGLAVGVIMVTDLVCPPSRGQRNMSKKYLKPPSNRNRHKRLLRLIIFVNMAVKKPFTVQAEGTYQAAQSLQPDVVVYDRAAPTAQQNRHFFINIRSVAVFYF